METCRRCELHFDEGTGEAVNGPKPTIQEIIAAKNLCNKCKEKELDQRQWPDR